jgi:hypothetical protein
MIFFCSKALDEIDPSVASDRGLENRPNMFLNNRFSDA